MIIKTVQTLVFEYPEDYQAEIEWNKKRDGDWVHQSTDTICSVYTLTNNYLIPTKAKHSFVDNPYFEAEPSNSEKPNNCEHITEDGVTCAKYPACDDCLDNPLNKVKGSERLVKGSEQTEPTISKMEQVEDDPQTEPLQTCSVNGRPYNECSSCEHFRCTADEPQTEDEILREQCRAFMGIVEQTEREGE